MKAVLKLLLIILLCFSLTDLSGQAESGYVFGMNLSTMKIKIDGVNYDAKRPAGVHFGRMVEIPFTRHTGMKTGFLFSAKGTDYTVDTSDFSLAPAYLEIPANFSVSLGYGKIKIFFLTGPFLACAFGGYKLVPSGPMTNINFGSGAGSDMKRLDAGLNAGMGIKIRNFSFSFQYQAGLRDISPLTGNSELKNQVIGISVMFRDR